ncbi:4-sulfomuconolactone hydrolase-like [Melia azedarach]|uniref:4-sulfomuconolactone hydrolase-like n=1 Tax=Melia azedarach TaxID=155640 RepID=A0ACC1XHF4_MELAZ|nr:4-sulfomuconolactone hydrolase-like [Melia azedarach]
MDMVVTKLLKPVIPALGIPPRHSRPVPLFNNRPSFSFRVSAAKMATTSEAVTKATASETKTIDSHLHIWASPEEAADKYPYFPGQEPTLPGNVDFLLQNMEEASVDGALIVQPINHKFDHSLVTSALKKYPSKFVGCCLANPAEDGSGIKQLEQLVLKDGFRAVRFNPYLWPSGQQMTNEVGKAMFSKAGELGVPVGFMCMKGLNLHITEIEELCTEFPSTPVLLDHLAFCTPPTNNEESLALSNLLKLSRFPQVYVKFSALFRVSRIPFPYQDLSTLLSQAVTSFGANRVMWGSDFPYVVPECGYKGGKEAVSLIANQVPLSSEELGWIMGGTVGHLFQDQWV